MIGIPIKMALFWSNEWKKAWAKDVYLFREGERERGGEVSHTK